MGTSTSWWERIYDAHASTPAGWEMPSLPSTMGLVLGTHASNDAPPRAFVDHARLWEAFHRDDLSLGDPVCVGARVAPAGRHLAASLLPARVRDEALGAVWSHARLARWLDVVAAEVHVEVASRCATALDRLGDAWLSRSGASWCLDDLHPPALRDALRDGVLEKTVAATRDYDDGLITDGERYNKILDAAAAAMRRLGECVRDEALGTPLYALRMAWPTPDTTDIVRMLRGAIGFVSTPQELVAHPVWRSLGEGVDAHAFFLRAAQGRAAERTERERLREVGALFGSLSDALGGWRITSLDCGDRDGETLRVNDNPYGDGPTLFERVERREVLRDVVDARGAMVVRAGELVERRHAARWIGVTEVTIRSAVACLDAEGVCLRCFGRDPDDGQALCLGDPVGRRAAWSIARLVARLRSRWSPWFLIGSSRTSAYEWRHTPLRGVLRVDADDLFVEGRAMRAGELTVTDDDGAMAVITVLEGDELRATPGTMLSKGQAVVGRDGWIERVYVAKIPAGVRARVELAPESAPDALIECEPWETGPLGWFVRHDVTAKLVLRSVDEGQIVGEVALAPGDGPIRLGEVVERGGVVATRRAKNAFGRRLPDLSELRRRLNLSMLGVGRRPAVLSAWAGVVVEVSPRRITVRRTDGVVRHVTFSERVIASVRAGQAVQVGDVLVHGDESLPRHLRCFGALAAAQRILGVLEANAATERVRFARVHGELLARAMLAWRRVRRPGDTGLRRNQVLAWVECERVQRETVARGGRAADVVPVLRGVRRMAGGR